MVDVPRSDRRQPPALDGDDPPRVIAPKTFTRRSPESTASPGATPQGPIRGHSVNFARAERLGVSPFATAPTRRTTRPNSASLTSDTRYYRPSRDRTRWLPRSVVERELRFGADEPEPGRHVEPQPAPAHRLAPDVGPASAAVAGQGRGRRCQRRRRPRRHSRRDSRSGSGFIDRDAETSGSPPDGPAPRCVFQRKWNTDFSRSGTSISEEVEHRFREVEHGFRDVEHAFRGKWNTGSGVVNARR